MKKWLILAVIAAVFMVTFPACGGDDDGGPSASSVIAKVYPSSVAFAEADGTVIPTAASTEIILITWEGGAGYDYAFYFQDRKNLAKIVGDREISRGQNLYTYEPFTPTGATAPTQLRRVLNTDKGQWSVLLYKGTTGTDATDGFAGYKGFFDAIGGGGTAVTIEGRFGVGPANPGGFPLESVKIQWDIENDDTGGATPLPTKQAGFLLAINLPANT
jgi:hypothetical protein